jgi:hypothetical protein
MFDYASLKEWPFFKYDFTLYPNKTQQASKQSLIHSINNDLIFF